jgi:hypothetical protein
MARGIPKVMFRAMISIDIEARDFLDAGEHQKTLERLMEVMRKDYPAATLALKSRRNAPFGADDASSDRGTKWARSQLRVLSGRMNTYE